MNTLSKVIIFGATSLIAEHTARILIDRGSSVYCIGRNEKKLQAVVDDLAVRAGRGQLVGGTAADLIDTDRHELLIDTAVEFLGGVDTVLVAHGTLPDQHRCQTDMDYMQHEVSINALSVINLISLVANRLERQEHGSIGVISSVAGDRGRQSNYLYGAAKGMVSIFTQGLRNRLAKSNVSVTNIKPGFVDTPMTVELDRSGPLWAQPETVACGIVAAMAKGSGDVYLPRFWWIIMLIIKNIPDFIFKRLSL